VGAEQKAASSILDQKKNLRFVDQCSRCLSMSEKKKTGRPKGTAKVRTSRVSGYVTEEDSAYIRELALAIGFTSTSELMTAMLERLVIGGFSGLVFAKLGWQFACALSDKKIQGGLYFGVRPLPPLIGDADDPDVREFRRFLREIGEEFKKIEEEAVC